MINYQKAEEAVHMLLEAIGEDPSREGLLDTPKRIAKMYAELLKGNHETASEHLSCQFNIDNGGLLLEKNINFYSLCEHHMLPFYGKVHIAYIANKKVVGLSKIARTIEVFARRLQLQEKMSGQIADAIMKELDTEGVMVVIEAEHLCMTMRGAQKPGTKTITIATRGVFENEFNRQQQVLDLIKQ